MAANIFENIFDEFQGHGISKLTNIMGVPTSNLLSLFTSSPNAIL